MWTVLAVLIGLLATVLAVLVVAMALPLRLELRLVKEDTWSVSGALRPFGRFGPRIPLSRDRKKAKTAPKPRRKRAPRDLFSRKSQRVAGATVRLLADILHRVRLETARLEMRFGIGDPAETGQVYGLLAPLIYGTASAPRTHVRIEPVFDRAVLSGRAELDMSLIPGTLLAPVIRFGWSAFGPER